MSEPARLSREIQVLRAEVGTLLARLERLEGELADWQRSQSLTTSVEVGPGSSPPRRTTGCPASAADYTRAEREEAARATGLFFARCLAGQFRGDSGRGRIRLANRIFVVVKDFRGIIYSPVKVFTSFAPVRSLVAEEGYPQNFGDSIFAGFASRWEAELAVEVSGLIWPGSED